MDGLDSAAVGAALVTWAWWTARIAAATGLFFLLVGLVTARREAPAARAATDRKGGAGWALAQLAALVAGGALAAVTRGEAERWLPPLAQGGIAAIAAIA